MINSTFKNLIKHSNRRFISKSKDYQSNNEKDYNKKLESFKESLKVLDKSALHELKYDKVIKNVESGIKYSQNGSPIYGYKFNNFIRLNSVSKKLSYKNVAAELFENKLIYDFSYDDFMNAHEKKRLVYQVYLSLSLNNMNKNPFSIMFANLNKDSSFFKYLSNICPLDIFYKNNLVTITDKSYLDHLPAEKIIYLSPHAEETLTEFDPNYHYVLGCFIDITFSKKLSHKKAGIEKIKTYKLPIDEYVNYSKQRHRLLPLPVVHQILLDKKNKVDWKTALECNLGSSRIIMELEEFEKKYKKIKKHAY